MLLFTIYLRWYFLQTYSRMAYPSMCRERWGNAESENIKAERENIKKEGLPPPFLALRKAILFSCRLILGVEFYLPFLCIECYDIRKSVSIHLSNHLIPQ